MSLCRIKNHHSSFRNLKLKRLIWQRSVYCENECHNKIVLFIHTGRNITINMDIIQMFFFIVIIFSLYYRLVTTLSTFPSTWYCDSWTFLNPNQCWIFCPEMRGLSRGKTWDIKVTYKKLPGAENQYGKK